MVHLSVEEVGKVMLNTTTRGGRGTRLVVTAIITLLLALAALTAQAPPALAQDETLTLTKTGMGTVTSDPAGIDCGDDCSEPYPSSEGEPICIPNRGCQPSPTVYQDVTLNAAPAPGWAFQSWSGDCSGTTCTVKMNSNKSVNATFTRISPSNDDFAAAQLISGATASVNGTTRDATREAGEPDHSSDTWSGDHTVWYGWTAPHTGDWNLDTCQANIDSILAVYTGGQFGALAKVKDDNNGCATGFGSKLTFRATAGTTYKIVVGDAGGAIQNTFTLALTSIPAPPNDNFANAQLISGTSASVNGTNVSATRESDDDLSETFASRSVWYRWTAPFSGSVALDTCTTNYDSLLSVSMGRSDYSFVYDNNGCLNSSNPSNFGSKLTFNAQKDQTYYIAVDGCCGAPAGTFTLALNLVDNVFPQTTIRNGPEDGSVENDTSPTFTFDADEPESTFECRLYHPSDLTKPAFHECSDGSMHTPRSALDPGTYTFDVRATDPRGNRDQTPATRTWTVDTVPPNAPSITSPADNSFDNTGNVTVSGTAEANSTVEVFDGATSKGTAAANGSGNWSMALTGVSEGPHTYTAKARDAAKNTSVASNARTVIVDTAGPTLKSWSPKGKKVKPTAKPTVTFSERMDERSVEASANGRPTTFVLKKGRTVIPATVSYIESGTTFKAILTPNKKLKAGAKYSATVTAAATDEAGNALVAKTWTFKVRR